MAGNEVLLKGRAELDAIHQSLKKITTHSKQAMGEIGNLGKRLDETLMKTVKKTENGIKATGSALRRLAGQLFSDFKALAALQSITGGMKLSNQFAGSIKESLKLNDSVRRLGNSFGIAKKDFGKFQTELSRGLGEIGASSEAAAQALEGMAGFGVKGIESVRGLAKGAVTLAGIGGERGNEKGVATGLASALQQSGKNVNDLSAQKALIGEVTAAVTTTGKSASEILAAMNAIFEAMPNNLRKAVGPKAMAQLAVLTTTGGPGVTKAFTDYLKKDVIQRAPMEAQGFKPFNGKGELDLKGIQKFIEETKKRGPGERTSLMTAGFSEEAAEGLVRLGERSEEAADKINMLSTATRNNEKAFIDTMGAVEAFQGSINTVKSWIEDATGGVSQKITEFLASKVGKPEAAGVVAGGALIASTAVGVGVDYLAKKVLGGKVGGIVGHNVRENMLEKDVQKVFVVNSEDMHGPEGVHDVVKGAKGILDGLEGPEGIAGAKGGSKLGGLAKGAAGLAMANPFAAAATGIALAATQIKWKGEGGENKNSIEHLADLIANMMTGDVERAQPRQKVHVTVDSKDPKLSLKAEPSRGSL